MVMNSFLLVIENEIGITLCAAFECYKLVGIEPLIGF